MILTKSDIKLSFLKNFDENLYEEIADNIHVKMRYMVIEKFGGLNDNQIFNIFRYVKVTV